MGWMSHPVPWEECDVENMLLHPRFAVKTQREDGSDKFRSVDHFSWSAFGGEPATGTDSKRLLLLLLATEKNDGCGDTCWMAGLMPLAGTMRRISLSRSDVVSSTLQNLAKTAGRRRRSNDVLPTRKDGPSSGDSHAPTNLRISFAYFLDEQAPLFT